jgi:hypothetical protein
MARPDSAAAERVGASYKTFSFFMAMSLVSSKGQLMMAWSVLLQMGQMLSMFGHRFLFSPHLECPWEKLAALSGL